MHAWLRRFAGFALLVAGCAPFKAGSGADAGDVDAAAIARDMEVRADMETDARTSPVDAASAFDASVDMRTEPVDAAVDSALDASHDLGASPDAWVDPICVAARTDIEPVTADVAATPRCCKVKLEWDGSSDSRVVPLSLAPFPPDESDNTAYVRVALPVGNLCYSISFTASRSGDAIAYYLPAGARMANATASAEDPDIECVRGGRSTATPTGDAFARNEVRRCLIGEPCSDEANPVWINSGTPLNSICAAGDPLCFVSSPHTLVIGWRPNSGGGLGSICPTDPPNFGTTDGTGCPADGDPFTALDDIPDCAW